LQDSELGSVPRGGTKGGGGHNSLSLWGVESLRGAPKRPDIVASTFFNTVDLLPKDLRFEHGGAKLASCPGRHLTSLRPCQCLPCWFKKSLLQNLQ